MLWIAYSGGLDSRVLLDLCYAERATLPPIHVIHIHHGLSPNADSWAEHCAQVCHGYGLDFHCIRVNLQIGQGESLEEVARSARYQAFQSLMSEQDILFTAHHQDDQAETVLLQLFRGAGLKGLSAMPEVKLLGKGYHARPLLNYTRRELEVYAKENHLQWIDDESNANTSLTRNFIRLSVMPLLRERWPNVAASLSRSAANCAEAQVLLEEIAEEKMPLMVGSKTGTLSLAKLLQMSPAWQRLIIRCWLAKQGLAMPDMDAMQSIQDSLMTAAHDRHPCIEIGGAMIRRHGDDIHCVLNGFDQNLMTIAKQGLNPEKGEFTCRYREEGETVTLSHRGRISLKNLLQEWRVPAWERSRLPLVFCGEILVHVPGYYQDLAYFLQQAQPEQHLLP